MKLTQLRYFVTVCEFGTLAEAARILHITQPSISAALKELEEEFEEEQEEPDISESGNIEILFTSDMHCGINEGFGVIGLQEVRESLKQRGIRTLLVDDGDAIQGDIVCYSLIFCELFNIIKVHIEEAGPSLRIRRLGSGNEKRPVIKSKRIFFKRAMFYLYFLKDKYKVPYICDTPKGENDYRIYEEPPPNTKSKMT